MSTAERLRGVDFGLVGAFPRVLAEAIVARVSRGVSLPCRLHVEPLDVAVAAVPGRNQLDADALLRALEEVPREPGHALVALTRQDIGSPIFTHFFGRARRGGHTAVVSLARLSPTFEGRPEDLELTLRRACVEVHHELGHIAGLAHCDDFACLMHLAQNAESIDLRGTALCTRCRALVPANELAIGVQSDRRGSGSGSP